MGTEPSPFMLERHMIKTEDWGTAPQEAQNIARAESADGVPTGISNYEGKWYVIQSSGQGPYTIWPEDPPDQESFDHHVNED